MKRYRYPVNMALFLSFFIPALYLIYSFFLHTAAPEVRSILGFFSLLCLSFALFKNKNTFTLLLGLSLLAGNFNGITVFENFPAYHFFIHIGSVSIPLYWGVPFFSLLLFIYILFNKGFYTGIVSKNYWTNFLSRTSDIETVYTLVSPVEDQHKDPDIPADTK